MQSNYIAIVITGLLCGLIQAEESSHIALHSQVIASDSSGDVPAQPRLSQMRDSVRGLLRVHAASKTLSEEIENTLPLIRIANSISADPRFATSQILQSLRGSVFARLRRVKKDTKSLVRRQKKRPKEIQIETHVLAQLNQARNANPNNVNNAAQAADFGPQLIELIQRTISPRSWDVNGGVSTIQYWRPGMALVVRAPQAVHREMSPLLRQLRK